MIIYKAENKINGKLYIGKTGSDLTHRRWGHLHSAKKGSKLVFHQAIRKYGEENFEFSVIEKCSPECDLSERERFHISQNDCIVPNGYNMTIGGDGQAKGWKNPMKGIHFLSEEVKAVIREKRALQITTEETKQKMRESQKKAYSEGRRKPWNKGLPKELHPNFGKKMSEEQREKISLSKRGENNHNFGKPNWNTGFTKETHPSLLSASEKKKGKPAWNKGLTKETDQRVSQYSESLRNSLSEGVWKKGRTPWNKGLSIPQTEESNIKRSKTMKGKPKSEETRLRMIEAQRLRRNQERQVNYAELSRSNSIQFP